MFLELLGYDEEQSNETTIGNTNTPSAPPKRQKQWSSGSDNDWKLMLESDHSKAVCTEMRNLLRLTASIDFDDTKVHDSQVVKVNTTSALFAHIKIIHYALHLLYEELKLNTMRSKDLPLLAPFLCQLSNDLGLKQYAVCYWKDFPELCKMDSNAVIQGDLKNIIQWSVMEEQPRCIMQHLYDMLKNVEVPPFPFIQCVNPRTKNIIQVSKVDF